MNERRLGRMMNGVQIQYIMVLELILLHLCGVFLLQLGFESDNGSNSFSYRSQAALSLIIRFCILTFASYSRIR